MNFLDRSWTAVGSALMIAIGLALSWLFAVGWIVEIVESRLRTRDGMYENIEVQLDGTPLIETRSITRYDDVTYRTLDGQPKAIKHENWLEGPGLSPAVRPRGLFDLPIGWGSALSASDFNRPPVDWYLIRDGETLGHTYFVGYEKYTSALVGFIARNGFRRTLPAKDEWFDCGRMGMSYGSDIATSSARLEYDTIPQDYGIPYDLGLSPWLVFVIDGGDLRQVDLRERTIKTIYSAPSLTSVAVLNERDPAHTQDDDAKPQVFDLIRKLAVRTPDKIVILDPPTGAKQEFTIPETLRTKQFSVFSIGNERLLLEHSKQEDEEEDGIQLLWLKPDGTLDRKDIVKLATSQGPSERQAVWGGAFVAPIPIVWIAAIFLLAPLGQYQELRVHSYVEGLLPVLQLSWAPMICVIIIGLIATYCALRLQRKYYRTNCGQWCAFVFLMGVPGLAAYWLEHRRAKLESCPECGRIVPRDRDSCEACNSKFLAPPLKGTEIFA